MARNAVPCIAPGSLIRWMSGVLAFGVGAAASALAGPVLSNGLGDARLSFLQPIATNAWGAREFLSTRDGTVFVLIPGGEVSASCPNCGISEQVRIEPYLIGKYEVTIRQMSKYRSIVGTDQVPAQVGSEDGPVRGVSQVEADRYCRWAGTRLPSEVEWHLAAEGFGAVLNLESWTHYSLGGKYFEDLDPMAMPFESENGKREAVTWLPRRLSPFGALGLSDGVAEWCSDEFLYCRSATETASRIGPLKRFVVRGGFSDEQSEPEMAHLKGFHGRHCPRNRFVSEVPSRFVPYVPGSSVGHRVSENGLGTRDVAQVGFAPPKGGLEFRSALPPGAEMPWVGFRQVISPVLVRGVGD